MSEAAPVRSIVGLGQRLLGEPRDRDFVPPSAEHWAVEPYVPINTGELRQFLLSRHACFAPAYQTHADGLERRSGAGTSVPLDEVFSRFADLLHHHYRPLFYQFAYRYSRLDPDRDTRSLDEYLPPSQWQQRDERETMEDVRRIADAGRTVLVDAGYSEVAREELEAAIGQCSHWGVPLDVDLDLFDAISVHARGDVIGQRSKRRWQTFYRKRIYDVPMYQRVVVMFKLRPGYRTNDELDDQMLHLRMFKNVPKHDIDMLLPGTRIRFSWLDHFRNFIPSLGGIGLTLFKLFKLLLFLAAMTVSIAIAFIWLCIALIGYASRSVRNHWNAKNLHMLNLTRSLYHQKLDSNAGVACRLLEEAEGQRYREVLLAYMTLLEADEPIAAEQLARRVKRNVREWIDVEIGFRVEDPVNLLDAWGLIRRDADERLSALPPELAIDQLALVWQDAFGA